MYSHLITLILLLLRVTSGMGKKCNGVVFRRTYYDKYLLIGSLGKPTNLMMHKYTGNLFFSHSTEKNNKTYHTIMSCHVESRHCTNIDDVPGGYAITYDRGNRAIFFGGHDGIYKYSVRKRELQFFGANNTAIWGLFARRNFYYIENPSKQLYIYTAGKFMKVKEAIGIEIDNFFVTRRFEIYYTNITGVYKVEKPSKPPIVINNKVLVRQIAQDIYGDLYFCAQDGIYMEDRRLDIIRKVADIKQPYGMAFVKIVTEIGESNQLIYSDSNSIYLLLPSKYKDKCMKVITKRDLRNTTTA